MPKSRGRHPKHKSGRRQPSEPSWETSVIRTARQRLTAESTRTEAELYASTVLSVPASQRRDLSEDPLQEGIDRLVAAAERRQTTEAAALLAALALIVDDAGVSAALSDWGAPVVSDLPWASTTPEPLRGVTRAGDAWGDELSWFLEYDDWVLVVLTARHMSGAVVSATLIEPAVLTDFDRDFAEPRKAVDTVASVNELLSAFEHTERFWPPWDDEDYLLLRGMLGSRLRAAVGEERVLEDFEPISDKAREALVDKFFADLGLTGDDVTREIVDLCLTYGDGWIVGGPLAWSPPIVEQFMLDWVPRKTFLEPEVRQLLPTVTFAFVGWALVESGVAKAAAVEAAQAALDLAAAFEEEYDDAERSPATQLAAYLEKEGVDVTDKEALDAAVSAYNAQQIATRLIDP